jgi:hypothetical protein
MSGASSGAFMKLLITAALIFSLPWAAWSQTDAKPSATTKAKSQAATKIKSPTVAEQNAPTVQDIPLTPAQEAIVPHVYTGQQACEAGVSVTLTADTNTSGYFNVVVKNRTYHMYPVVTLSGAVRLEESMMMNQKSGSRLADDCINPAQAAVALAMKNNATPGLLDAKK